MFILYHPLLYPGEGVRGRCPQPPSGPSQLPGHVERRRSGLRCDTLACAELPYPLIVFLNLLRGAEVMAWQLSSAGPRGERVSKALANHAPVEHVSLSIELLPGQQCHLGSVCLAARYPTSFK